MKALIEYLHLDWLLMTLLSGTSALLTVWNG